MIIRSLTHDEVRAQPYRVWNAFVNLLWMERYEDLSPEQRRAQLVIHYEGEIQNGGHLQYFEKKGTKHLSETIEALGVIGAAGQQQVLREAGAKWLSHPRKRIQTAQEYCDIALAGEFDSFDSRFYDCSPPLTQCLEAYLERHQDLFVRVT
jgi:hypothetical protein